MCTRPTTLRSLALAALAALASAAPAQTYNSAGVIIIPDAGNASPYPSTITVTQGPTSIAGLTVTLQRVSHTYPADLRICLVAPSGAGIMLLREHGGGDELANATLIFSATGATLTSQPLNSGTYRPFGGSTAGFPVAEPLSTFEQFQDLNANGTWRLYVFDDLAQDSGSIINWSITFSDQIVSLAQQTLTYQGRLDGGISDGPIDIRYSVWRTPSSIDDADRLTPNRIAANVTLQGNLFSANLPLRTVLPTANASYLQLEVANPAGTAFVPLTPRQLIRPAPLAQRAVSAAAADVAAHATSAVNATTATNAAFAESAASAQVAIESQSALSAPWSGLTGQPGVTNAIVSSAWQFHFTNGVAPTFRGGLRLSDLGFFEVTNRADVVNASFARLSSTGGWTAVSDARLKTNITASTGNLAAAMRLRPVNFRWNETGLEDFGLIAQEVRSVLPAMVVGDEAAQMLTVNYSQLAVVAIGAIQELKVENDALRARLDHLERVTGVSAGR
jgi:subtilisin-like proprotein convertase family protein